MRTPGCRASRARQKGDVLPARPIEHVRVRRAVEAPLSGPRCCAAPTSTAPHGNGAAVNALRLRALRPSGTLGLASEISAWTLLGLRAYLADSAATAATGAPSCTAVNLTT